MVACFTPPSGKEIRSPFPAEIFMPERTLFMSGEISDEIAKVAIKSLLRLQKEDPVSPIFLWINSEGGDVEAGSKIKEAIEKLTPTVSTVAIGQASSMAAFLASSCSGPRLASESTTLMFHGARYMEDIRGPIGETLAIGLELSESTKNQLFAPLARRSGQTVEQLTGLFAEKDQYFDASSAVKHNFLDKVVTPAQGTEKHTAGTKASYKITIEGELQKTQINRIITQIIAGLLLKPQKDISLIFNRTWGGELTDGLALFDLIRLVNSLPACGRILTIAKGSSLNGVSVLIFAAGAERKIGSKTKLVTDPIETLIPAYTPGPAYPLLMAEARVQQVTLIQRFSQCSNQSPEALSFLAQRQLRLSAKKALQSGFADQIV
ncbi:hypothetical protein A2232_02215 [candidate division WOR-1 bacterium RIFOXYA2_FULL_46_56]|uniref:ATP-dependent Clp protease proteolytic subunit n=1 Tax=candidate division WOR-1 bacterium RIFOXYC2_FULL_46_14 TaxID=1802587 RepID=A0A1F4U6U9_UNCSA|nr:MAG: hypothetical protein A2232_02215 [candidate division WOR-1 bacterium RIFOXYA2_FULL_46_56]OGC40540.1 MAG: hypothetical protein A2438_05930 [candidate division WOR-1 bacterium RIFOXYC2_FULL_46_14]